MMFGPHTKVSKDFNRARRYLPAFRGKCAVQLALSFLIQDVGDTQQVFRRPDVDVNFFRRAGIGVPENGAYKLDRDTFFVQGCGEIVSKGMRTEPRYPGVPGKFITETVQAVLCLVALY